MHEALGDRIAEHAFHLDAAMHRLLTDLRIFDAAGAWGEAGARSCASWLSWRVGWDPGTAREHVRVARALGSLPLIDTALREGRLSYSKVRALTRVATPATEAALVDDAHHTTAAQLEVICRALRSVQRLGALSPDEVRARRTVTRRERDDGLVAIEAVLPPDEAALVWAALEHEARLAGDAGAAAATDVSAGTPIAPRFDRADGLVAMSQAALRGDAPDRTPIEVVLTVSRETLATTDVTDATIPAIGAFGDGTGVSAETAQRLACDCGVVHLTEDADGQIELRDGALCVIHHGQPLPPEPPRTVDTALGWPTIRADNADLEITAATGQCAWDGRPVDYELVVDSLLNLAQSPSTS